MTCREFELKGKNSSKKRRRARNGLSPTNSACVFRLHHVRGGAQSVRQGPTSGWPAKEKDSGM